MLQKKLDEVFEEACDAAISGLKARGEEAAKARPQLIKSALELLKFTGYEVDINYNGKARQIASMVTHDEECGNIIDAEFSLPFDGNDQPVRKESC